MESGIIIRAFRPDKSGGARVALVVTVGRRSARCLDLGTLAGFFLPVPDAEQAPVLGTPRRGYAARLDHKRRQLKRHGVAHAAALAVRAVQLLRDRARA